MMPQLSYSDFEDAQSHYAWIKEHERRKAVALAMRQVEVLTMAEGDDGKPITCYAHSLLGLSPEATHELFIAAVVADADREIAKKRAALERLGVVMEKPAVVLALPAPEVAQPVKQAKRMSKAA